MGTLWRSAALAAFVGVVGMGAGGDPFQFSYRELAPGVWVGVRENGPRVPVMGTAVFVVGAESVLVFDGGGVPIMSDRLIEKIRSVTDRPVTHVVVSHWHGDHNLGIHRFAEAYPDVQFVGHPYTRTAMLGPQMDYIDGYGESMDNQVPAIEAVLERGTLSDGTPIEGTVEAWYTALLEDAPAIDRQFELVGPVTPPEVLVQDRLVVDLGGREVELLHLGRGNTQGDVLLWLPQERIVATGDLVVRPTPYGFGSHPRAWARTLEAVKALDYEVLVPGHGDLQTDTRYVDLLIETLDGVADQTEALVAAGADSARVAESLDFSGVEPRFTGGDQLLSRLFNVWFKQPIARAAYRIATGESPEVSN